ncbi:MAG: winged helix-turn-helix domain-containing protein [Candidatus Odinarchaeota archaeon]
MSMLTAEETAKLLNLVSHPIRVNIVKILKAESRSFSDLMKYLSLESTSKLSFHLEKLSTLVKKDEGGYYELTPMGYRVNNLLVAFERDELITAESTALKMDSSRLITGEKLQVGVFTLNDYFNKAKKRSEEYLTTGDSFLRVIWINLAFIVVIAAEITFFTLFPLLSIPLIILPFLPLVYGTGYLFLVLPAISFWLHTYICQKRGESFRTLFLYSFTYLIFYVLMVTLLALLLISISRVFFPQEGFTLDILKDLVYTFIFSEIKVVFLYEEYLLESTSGFLILWFFLLVFWSIVYGIFLILLYVVSPYLKLKWPLPENKSTKQQSTSLRYIKNTFWIVTTISCCLSILLNYKMLYELRGPVEVFFSPAGVVFPLIIQIFPLFSVVSVTVFLYVVHGKYDAFSGEKSLKMVLILVLLVIIEPLIVVLIATTDYFAFQNTGLYGSIDLYLYSKILMGIFQLLGLGSFTLLVLELINKQKRFEKRIHSKAAEKLKTLEY